MKRTLAISELDRVVKFAHELDQLSHTYQVGLSSYEAINLSIDGLLIPFELEEDGDRRLSLVVSV